MCSNITFAKDTVTHTNGAWVKVLKYLMLDVLESQKYELK